MWYRPQQTVQNLSRKASSSEMPVIAEQIAQHANDFANFSHMPNFGAFQREISSPSNCRQGFAPQMVTEVLFFQ